MEFWPEVLSRISEKIAPASFETWLKDTSIEIEDDLITFYAKNEFSRHWVEQRYADLVYETIKEVTGISYTIQFVSEEQESYQNTNIPFYSNKNEVIDELFEKIENLEARVVYLESKL